MIQKLTLRLVRFTGLLSLLFVSLFYGCVRDSGNMPPVLLSVVEDLSVVKDSSIILGIQYTDGFDEDGDDFTLHLHDGNNYSVIGLTVVPDSGFIGDVLVPLQLFDGIAYSNLDTMIISVVTEIVVMPVLDSSWWSYNDSALSSDSVLTSILKVGDSIFTISIDSLTTKDVYTLSWSNLDEYNINYLIGNEPDGQYQYGIMTPQDTIIKPQLQHMYPCSLGASWPFTLIKYNVTDSLLFEDTTVTMTCTNTAAYIKVPAGAFKCYEYTFYYDLPEDRSIENILVVNMFGVRSSSYGGTITEKIYYADGVGYVQNTTMNGNSVIWKKVLTDYYVEEIVE